MKKKLVWIGIGVDVLALVAVGSRPKPLPVDVAAVTRGPFQLTVDEDGETRIRERYTVSAPFAGTLARIALRPGDPVEPGTVVARLAPLPSPLLDPRARQIAEQRLASAKDAHSQSQAAVARAEASLELARQTTDRDRALVGANAVPPQGLERAQTEQRMQEGELASLRFAEKVAAHAVEEAQLALASFSGRTSAGQQLVLTSPVHGAVLHVLREDGGVVAAGQALVEIGDPASLEVVVPVLSQDAVELRPGMPATLDHFGGAGVLHAHLRRVEPAAFTRLSALGVEEQRVNALLDFDDPAAARGLGDGYALEAHIVTWSAPDVAQLPTSALFREGQGWAVFAVQDGRAALRAVTVGHRGPLEAELRSGLSVSTQVIVHPAPTLKAGALVAASGG